MTDFYSSHIEPDVSPCRTDDFYTNSIINATLETQRCHTEDSFHGVGVLKLLVDGARVSNQPQ